MLTAWKKSFDKPRKHIKKQRHYFVNQGLSSQSYGFSRSHVWMLELDNKKGWALKSWCLQTVVLEKTLESPLDSKEIKPINLKGNQPWIPLEGLMLKLKRQYFSHLMQTTDSLEKSLSLGKIEGRKRRGLKGWDGWMASLMQWTWTWANLGRWWGTERPGVLQSIELDKTEWVNNNKFAIFSICDELIKISVNKLVEILAWTHICGRF